MFKTIVDFVCRMRKGVSKDLERAAHYLKLAADQGYAVAQNNYGINDVSIKLCEKLGIFRAMFE
jgi:hypothetical protein